MYGNEPALLAGLPQRRVGYVLAVSCDHRIPTSGGLPSGRTASPGAYRRACWQRLSVGIGSKAHRTYSWTYMELAAADAGHSWILMRNDSTGELAYHRCHQAESVPLGEPVRVAGHDGPSRVVPGRQGPGLPR